ncbi:hypothetical protein SLS60_008421 [Paraconiothyrium brasiliense]|uniref:Uncharacterized protein n=1 Tax=Paraconiothyrium brasiliense TaxID=300254 RepID=A0ABR3R0V7_9PLEO
MVSHFPILAPLVGFFLCLPILAQNQVTYWIQPMCDDDQHGQGQFRNAVTEAIWNAGQVAQSLSYQDQTLADPLKWMFGFDYSSVQPGGIYNYNLVWDTFDRIGGMVEVQNREDAIVRIYCDNDSRFKAVDGQGNEVAEPSPTDPAYANHLFLDSENDSILTGNALSCKKTANLGMAQGPPASTQGRINEAYDMYRNGVRPPSTQSPYRVTMTFCHVPALSSKQFIEDSGEGVLTQTSQPYGVDYHGPGRVNGYYQLNIQNKAQTQAPGQRGLDRLITIMNPDSYAYLAAIRRLRGKQLRTSVHPSGSILVLNRDLTLPLEGDWPGSGS